MDSAFVEKALAESSERTDLILKALGKGRRILDLGCATGLLAQKIKERNNEVHGIDLNAEALAKAAEKGIKTKVFDLNNGIPFQDAHFDAVHVGYVLEKVYDTEYLLDEIHRVLKSPGIAVFSVLNLNSLANRLRVLSGKFVDQYAASPADHNGANIRMFNLEKLQSLLMHSGFALEECIGIPLPRTSHRGRIAGRLLSPVARLVPQIGDSFFIRARKVEN